MRNPALWIILSVLLLFGVLAVLRLVTLLGRDVTMLARRARMHTAGLERAAADLRTEVRLAGDRAARITRRRPRV